MTPPKSKKRHFWSRCLSLFEGRSGKSTVGSCQDSAEIANAVVAPSQFDHLSTTSVSNLALPASNSTPQCHESQLPTFSSRSESKVVDSSQSIVPLVPGNQDLEPPPFPPLQSYDNPPAPGAHGGTTSFLQGASGFQIKDFHVNVNSVGDKSIDGWELLLKNIAPNALHDSRARYDAPKCDEDTRVEVTGEIMEWVQDSNAPQRILCMTGAAGSGKSALQQTIAERCTKLDILSAAFFFSSEDPTRNTISYIIPTIAYQIGLKHDIFQSSVAAAVKRDPYIFSRSLQSQMDELIVRPFKSLQRSKQIVSNTFPYAILIDGLDECNGETNTTSHITHVEDRRRAEDQQDELLVAIKHCILDNNLPFRVFIASRPEWAIRTALKPGGHLCKVAYHIQLSDQYDASADMRRYLWRRFEDIGLRIGDSEWFSEGDIETLVQAASGQFIYVAMVYKYISERRASPAERLKIVLTWTPREGQATRPFEVLDKLYTNILSAAKNAYEAVDSHDRRDFLLLFRAQHIGVTRFNLNGPSTAAAPSADILSAVLCLEARAEEALISDLRSLVALQRDNVDILRLHLYHKSFSDFLDEPSRAKDLFVPESRVYTHLAKCIMQHIIECPLDFDSVPAQWKELPLSNLHRRSLRRAVEDLPFSLNSAPAIDDDEVVAFTDNGGWQRINNVLPLLYQPDEWLSNVFQAWIGALRNFTDHLKARKPEVAAAISVFAEKWTNDFKEYIDDINSRDLN